MEAVGLVDVGAGTEEHADCFEVALFGGLHEDEAVLPVAAGWGGPVVEQLLELGLVVGLQCGEEAAWWMQLRRGWSRGGGLAQGGRKEREGERRCVEAAYHVYLTE